jgi:hypothetical protein
MKTAVNIPWDALVETDLSSRQHAAKCLPLVVSQNYEARSSVPFADARSFIRLLESLPTSESLSIRHGSGSSARIDSILYSDEIHAIAMLTSDGESSVVLQSISSSWAVHDTHDPALAADALIRTYVLRYARLDADAGALVLPALDEPNTEDRTDFIRPLNWGFRSTTTDAYAWTASRLDPDMSTMRNAYCSENDVLVSPYRSPFDPPLTSDRGDPLQCLPPLRHVRATLERRFCSKTNSLHAEELCYWPALALGRCRLFGVQIDDASDFTLAPTVFFHASRWLMKRMSLAIRWAERAEELRKLGGAYFDQNLALELLELRMDAHAAYQALDEAYAAARYESYPQADAMGRRLNQVRRIINLFDGNLKKQLPLLRLAASTFLLENWRRLLAPSHRASPPGG